VAIVRSASPRVKAPKIAEIFWSFFIQFPQGGFELSGRAKARSILLLNFSGSPRGISLL
jgi:hypothetical protein